MRLNNIPNPCPFCRSNASRLRVVDKWSSDRGANKRRIAYVRCLECNARGPIAKGLYYDVRNERPSMGSRQLIHEAAVVLWNAYPYVASTLPQDEFKLESEAANG